MTHREQEGETLMGNRLNRRTLKIVALLAAGLVLAAVTAATRAPASSNRAAAIVLKELCAKAGTVQPLPVTQPGLSIPIWGFGEPTIPGDCSTATASLPGPAISVNEGDVVSLVVTNALPGSRSISIEAPGISFDPGPTDAASGATVVLTFTAGAPGTYLYQSSGDAERQTAMGLYGALVVHSNTVGQAYDDASTAYDVEAPLVLSAVDPAFNADPDNSNLYQYRATYWLINGSSYPDTAPISAPAGSRLLLRYLNAGFDNSTMIVLGMHEQVLARDANLLNNPFEADAETIPAGATEDAIATVPATGAGPNGFALYNRQLHVTNGTPANANYSPGGMMTFIQP
jgi:FtsP/CotA-like multicopper oxidase with cupredoxin domain